MELEAKISSIIPDAVSLKFTDENGLSRTKTVSLSDYLEFVRSTVSQQKAVFMEPISSLPCNLSGIMQGKKAGDAVLAIFVPEGKKRMHFSPDRKESVIYPEVAFPSLVFIFSVEGFHIRSSLVFAVKEKVQGLITGNTRLYNYPYGNVNPSSGSICFGGNRKEVLTSFKDLETYIGLFFSTETNTDLFRSGSSVTKGLLVTVIEKMSRAKHFDKKLLVDSGRTLSEQLQKAAASI